MSRLTTLALVSPIVTIPDSVANQPFADAGVKAAVELRFTVALTTLKLIALVWTVGKTVAAPRFWYANAIGATKFVIVTACSG